ncbi:MAG TPA: hypothetical protein VGV89_09690 [Thermoplasmata archaeon]|nr:hypothetical protein [Thermoplasmata archaeon]
MGRAFAGAATAFFPVPVDRTMALRRTHLELSVERELPAEGGEPPARARLTARFEAPEDGAPTERDLHEAMDQLRRDLDAAVGRAPNRPDRELAELIETYRPRQGELVDLLLDEGELSQVEHDRLRDHLRTGAPPADRPAPMASAAAPHSPEPHPAPAASLASAPLGNDRAPSTARPVAQLLQEYQIGSLKQAGAVRARRQISYEEYMALKRHFAEPTGPTTGTQ